MPCFGCVGYDYFKRRSRSDDPGIYTTQESTNRAENFKQQLMVLPKPLSEQTYGLRIDTVKNRPYRAEDFFFFGEILGTGATGIVFRCTFKPTGKIFAVKMIPRYRNFKQTIIRELTMLRHFNSCKYFVQYNSDFHAENNLYIVMECCDGGSLHSMFSLKGIVPPFMCRVFIKEIALGVFYLHERRIIHRDVTLFNICLAKTGHVRLIDFGLCRRLGEYEDSIIVTDCGHPAYRAPEVYLDQFCSFPVDWWGLGVCLYRMITGAFPFHTEKLTESFQSVTKLPVKFPDWLAGDKHALSLCQRLLVKNPKKRLGTENEVKSIKEHPFFEVFDWDVEDNMMDVVDFDTARDFHRCTQVIITMRKFLEMPESLDASSYVAAKRRAAYLTGRSRDVPSLHDIIKAYRSSKSLNPILLSGSAIS